MTDKTQPEAGSTHIIRYALELGLLWIDGDGRDKVREALDALDALEAKLASIGAGGVQALSTSPAEQQAAPKAAPVKACVCGEPQASGTVHRVDGPCYVAATQPEPQEPCGWDGAEEWEKLAWHLCAEENGEDACNELIWEGGPMPEPWGDRWLKYEGEARRMIDLVRTHVPAPQQEAQEPCPSCKNSDIYACTCPFQTSRNAAPQPAPVPTSATGGDWTQPTTVALRLGDAMQLLCGGKRPPDNMVQQWLDNTSESLQEFAACNGPAWAQGIGLIDAALVMVDQPTEITAIDDPDRDHEHRAVYATASSQPAPAPLSDDTERLREALQRIEGASMSMYATRSDMLEHCQDIARAALAAQGDTP